MKLKCCKIPDWQQSQSMPLRIKMGFGSHIRWNVLVGKKDCSDPRNLFYFINKFHLFIFWHDVMRCSNISNDTWEGTDWTWQITADWWHPDKTFTDLKLQTPPSSELPFCCRSRGDDREQTVKRHCRFTWACGPFRLNPWQSRSPTKGWWFGFPVCSRLHACKLLSDGN